MLGMIEGDKNGEFNRKERKERKELNLSGTVGRRLKGRCRACGQLVWLRFNHLLINSFFMRAGYQRGWDIYGPTPT
jgi:hypothetical protein